MAQKAESFTQRLVRLLNGRTGYWLAQQTGLSITYANRLVSGKAKRPSSETMAALAEALNVPVAQLMGIEAAPSSAETLPDEMSANLKKIWPQLTPEDRTALVAHYHALLTRYGQAGVAQAAPGVAGAE